MAEPMKNNSLMRLLALYVVSFVAIGLAEPHRGNAFVAGGALVPAIVGWLVVRRKPVGLVRAVIRGGGIVLLFAGFVALGSPAAIQVLESVKQRVPTGSQAKSGRVDWIDEAIQRIRDGSCA